MPHPDLPLLTYLDLSSLSAALNMVTDAPDAQLSQRNEALTQANKQLEETTRRAEYESARASESETLATKYEKELKSTSTELRQARLNGSNLESQLRSTKEKLDESEREAKQLQYRELEFPDPKADAAELESASSPFGAPQQDGKLAAQLRAAQADNARLEKEIQRLKSDKVRFVLGGALTLSN